MKKFFLYLFLFLQAVHVSAQIRENERLVYVASYNMKGLMTQLAQVTMETKSANTSRSRFMHLKLSMSTFSRWDSYFRIRDVYESYVNPESLTPSLYRRDVAEGNYRIVEKYVYQPDGRTVTATVKQGKKPERTGTFAKKPKSVDIVAVLYQLRSVDFSRYSVGQAVSIDIIFDEKELSAQFKYMGKETVSVGKFGRMECYKLSLSANTDALKGKDSNLIWLTADSKRIPVLAQFNIPVGNGKIEITEMN